MLRLHQKIPQLIDFKALKKHLPMFFDLKSEELRYLFCFGEKRKKEQCPTNFYFNNFCNKERLKRKQRGLPSKKRRKKRKGKELITARRFNFKMKTDITLPLLDTKI